MIKPPPSHHPQPMRATVVRKRGAGPTVGACGSMVGHTCSAVDRHKVVAKMYFVFQTKHTTAGGGKGPIKLSGQTANNATVESVRHERVVAPDGTSSLQEVRVVSAARDTREVQIARLSRVLTKRRARREVVSATARQVATAVRKGQGHTARAGLKRSWSPRTGR